MVLAIEGRPTSWDQIVGQERPVRLLRSILKRGRFNPRGFILEGPSGVGKSSTARVIARSLMCTGDDPLGCGKCPSCLMFAQSPEQHPDFLSVDAASNAGVESARSLATSALEIPVVGKTRVIVVDEAHRMSQEAWDVFLAPLERPELACTFIFCTTAGQKIPKTIRGGRCCRVPFSLVSTEGIVGLLVVTCSKHNIPYEMDGLRQIARASRGHVRDAVSLLDKVADTGTVTKDAVRLCADVTLPTLALNTLVHIAAERMTEAVNEVDALVRASSPAKAVEELFSAFGRAVLGDSEATEEEARRYTALRLRFPDVPTVTSTLLRWSATERVPADAIPLLIYELDTQVVVPGEAPATPAPSPVRSEPEAATPAVSSGPRKASPEDVARLLGGKLVNRGS